MGYSLSVGTVWSVFKDVGFFYSHSVEMHNTYDDALKIGPNLSLFQSVHYLDIQIEVIPLVCQNGWENESTSDVP